MISQVFNSLVSDPLKRAICHYDTDQCRTVSKVVIAGTCGLAGGIASHYAMEALGVGEDGTSSVVATLAIGTGVSMFESVSNVGEKVRNWACEG